MMAIQKPGSRIISQNCIEFLNFDFLQEMYLSLIPTCGTMQPKQKTTNQLFVLPMNILQKNPKSFMGTNLQNLDIRPLFTQPTLDGVRVTFALNKQQSAVFSKYFVKPNESMYISVLSCLLNKEISMISVSCHRKSRAFYSAQQS